MHVRTQRTQLTDASKTQVENPYVPDAAKAVDNRESESSTTRAGIDLDRWVVRKTTWGTWIAFALRGEYCEFSDWQNAVAHANRRAVEVA